MDWRRWIAAIVAVAAITSVIYWWRTRGDALPPPPPPPISVPVGTDPALAKLLKDILQGQTDLADRLTKLEKALGTRGGASSIPAPTGVLTIQDILDRLDQKEQEERRAALLRYP